MSISSDVVNVISKASPFLGTLLGGPIGGVVGTLMSNTLGVSMTNPFDFEKKMEEPGFEEKLKKFEDQVKDIQDARNKAASESGGMRFVRPALAVLAFMALFVDIVLIAYLDNEMVKQILIAFTGMLVFDIKQIYKFYFGSGEDSAILPNVFKKSKY